MTTNCLGGVRGPRHHFIRVVLYTYREYWYTAALEGLEDWNLWHYLGEGSAISPFGFQSLFNPNGTNTLSFAILLATAPPCSSASAPMMARTACAYTRSAPEAWSRWGWEMLATLVQHPAETTGTYIFGVPSYHFR